MILIVADALRADRLSLQGGPRPTSPNLENLARDGVVFERAFSQAPWTPPSMASMMTGTYPSSHRVIHVERLDNKYSVLDGRFETLAELFRSVGYRTGAFTAQPWVSGKTGFDQGFEDFRVVSSLEDPHGNDKVMLGGIEWLEQRRDERFFLYLHTMDPHFPYEVPELFRFDDVGVPSSFRNGIDLDTLGAWNDPRLSPSADEVAHLLAVYDAEIRYVDWWIGVLDRHLRHRGLREETLIVFTSDHGEAFYEHGRYGHISTLFNEMLHIPLILSQPGLVAEPRRQPEPVETIDLLPTLAKLVGFDLPENVPGTDLLNGELPGLAYSEGDKLQAFKLQSSGMSVVVNEAHKTWAVFDLTTDPGEQNNVAEQRMEEGQRLVQLLLKRRRAAGELAFPDPEDAVPLDEETLRELEALGYVG